jgi:lysine 6-dehydrogenase
MKKVIVLGAGLVGKVMAADLSKDYDVTVADIAPAAPEAGNVKRIVCDFSDKSKLKDIVKSFDLVMGAVPGFMGFEVLKTVIETEKNVVDISFFPENALDLDDLAKKQKVTAIVDCGVAPGMCNIIAGYHNARMKMSRYECLVGGLPQIREWPFEYKAVFSPIDVIEEYTRPARFVENGKVVVREALSDIEKVEFDGIGILESFNSDGLRSLAITMPNVPNMKEKTLRYPGHAELMRIFRESGFFSKEKININGKEILPLELTTKLLFPKWKMKDGDEDFTMMRVTIEGDESGKHMKYVYHLHDKFDRLTKTTSMARTTGYTCTAAAHLVLENKYNRKGISPPEYIGEDETCFHFVLRYLKERNVIYKKEIR